MRRLTTWGLALTAALTLGTLAAAPAQAAGGSTLTVSVVTPAGSPVQGASVTATSTAPGSYPGYGYTGNDGKATIDDLDPGSYTVTAEGYLGSYHYNLSGSVTVGASAVSTTLKIAAAGVSGKVTAGGSPVKNTGVILSPATGKASDQYASTDASGRYSLFGIAPGRYTVQVSASTWQAPYFLATYYGNTVREPEATIVTVTSGSERAGTDIAVKADAGVSGKVVTSAGKPASGVYVYGENLDRAGYASAQTDASGSFTLHGLASGPVQLTTWSNTATVDATATKKVTTVTGKTVAAGTLRLGKAKATGSISGVVKNKAGKKSPAYVVTLPTKADPFGASSDAISKSKGKFTIKNLLPGRYKVAVAGTNTYKTVTVRAKKTTKAGTLVKPKGTTISGVVKTSSGKAAKKVNVWAQDSLGTYLGSTTTSAKGKYTIKGAWKGKYTVVVGSTRTDLTATKAVTVRKGHKAKANLRLVKGRTVTATVAAGAKKLAGVTVTSVSGSYAYGTTGTSGRVVLRPLERKTTTLEAQDPYTGGYLDGKVKISSKATTAKISLKSRG